MTLRAVHDFELALLEPVLGMADRGILVDEARRVAMLADLDSMKAPLSQSIREMVVAGALLQKINSGKLPRANLFVEKWCCKCCRGGSKQRADCKRCGAKPCRVCNGVGKGEELTFNPSSEAQLKVVLYEVLRLPKKLRRGKVTTDEDALKDLLVAADDFGRELIQALLKFGKIATIREILERLAPGEDGRIRSFMNPAGTETGRFSHAESFLLRSTNLANLPKREVTDRRFDVRRVLVPDSGMAMVEADLSGAEAWVTAACCGDHDLLARLAVPGFDVHRFTAARIFGKPMDDVSKRERHLGKVARHALNYGMQWLTFQRNVNAEADKTGVSIDAAMAKRIVAQYHELHPKLEMWWRAVAARLERDGALTTTFGRRRHFFGRSRNEWLGETHREAIAYEPQSTVADLLNRGLLRWWQRHEGRVGQLLAQIHDAVLIQVPVQRAGLAGDLLRKCLMEEVSVHGSKITIPVDVTVSEHWGTWKGEAA